MKCSIKQDVFLAISVNKSRFITILLKNLQRTGNKVVECEEDADTHIVRCALELATTGVHVSVAADDTDVVLLLLYHWNDIMADITIYFENMKASFSMKSSINSHSSLLTLLAPIPDKEKKVNLNFYFHISLWCLRRFYDGLLGLHKTF